MDDMDYISRINNALSYIECNLKTKITLHGIAKAAFFSEYHFHRLFQALTGENVMFYIRKRRLTEAAKELVNEKLNILTISILFQFESQESFTRAFKKMFGITPGKYRQQKKEYLMLYKNPITIEKLNHYKEYITMEPKFIEKDEIKVIGISCSTTLADNKVPELWQKFIPRMSEIRNTIGQNIALGICLYEPEVDYREFSNETEFTEIAGLPVSDFSFVPEKMLTHVIPPSKYAVFTHKGSVETLKKTYDYIFGVWIPNSKRELAEADNFEWYDERFISPDNPSSEMDIYIPIK